ncbi:MAG: heme NO-binding domain-containing protein [Planctomycetota bacterium]|jgi:hypothetical protein|nr:heme NO-binding domain-containing protein [Planctomycetota bacterium]
MYGLVNHSLCAYLLLQEGGGSVISELSEEHVVPPLGFELYDPYDDEITYKIVGKACEMLKLDAADLLVDFGKYWIHEVGPGEFPELIALAGNDFESFIKSLNLIHDRGHAMFPSYRPPAFRVEGSWSEGKGVMDVFYASHREGLEPFVVGLLVGIGERCGEALKVITHPATRPGGEIRFEVHR